MRAYPFRQCFDVHRFEPGMTFYRIITMTCLDQFVFLQIAMFSHRQRKFS